MAYQLIFHNGLEQNVFMASTMVLNSFEVKCFKTKNNFDIKSLAKILEQNVFGGKIVLNFIDFKHRLTCKN